MNWQNVNLLQVQNEALEETIIALQKELKETRQKLSYLERGVNLATIAKTSSVPLSLSCTSTWQIPQFSDRHSEKPSDWFTLAFEGKVRFDTLDIQFFQSFCWHRWEYSPTLDCQTWIRFIDERRDCGDRSLESNLATRYGNTLFCDSHRCVKVFAPSIEAYHVRFQGGGGNEFVKMVKFCGLWLKN